MTKFFSVARDAFGNVVPEATITVFEAGSETLRAIFSDNDLTLSKLNPFTGNDDGTFDFFTEPGEVKIRIEKSGFPTNEVDFVPIANTDATPFQAGARWAVIDNSPSSTSNVQIADSVGSPIQFDNFVYEQTAPSANFNTGNPGEFVIPSGFGGIYQMTLKVELAAVTPALDPITLTAGTTSVDVNTVQQLQELVEPGQLGVSGNPFWTLTGQVQVVDGDVIRASMFQTSGGTIALIGRLSLIGEGSFFDLGKAI